MKNQGETKNRNKFDSYKFILFIADLIGLLFILSTPSLPLSVQIFKKQGLDRISIFKGGLLGKSRVTFFRGRGVAVSP